MKYLGHIICSDLSDDEDMMRQSPESLDIERFHFRRAILDLEQVAPLVDGGGGSSERLQ